MSSLDDNKGMKKVVGDDDDNKKGVVHDDDNKNNENNNNSINDSMNNNNNNVKEEPLYYVNQDWELTWPIWHMLPRDERRSIANKYGYKTIGEFEEYMTLQRAVDNSTTTPYDNESIYPNNNNNKNQEDDDNSNDKKPAAVTNTDNKSKKKFDSSGGNDDDDESIGVNEELEEEIENEHIAAADKLPTDKLLQYGGLILILAEDILHKIFDWLPVDTYSTLALVSPHWKSFTRTETVYKRLCERLYLNQSKKRVLHVSKFNNSYRLMLEIRPRIRAMGGCYVMKYSQVRKIQRDMFTEIPIGAVLEIIYYRYLYFQEDGRVLYALTATPPHEMFPRLLRVCLNKSYIDKSAVWGTYTVQKTNVTVHAKQSWQYVQFHLLIDIKNTIHGRYGCLSCIRHRTSTSGKFDNNNNNNSIDTIEYNVPEEPFRFIRDKRL